ncbi:uncharacterized protein LOC135958548 [Calliphora vicina]|uniref:uncharacterized protein LOC135958548 n=1 Tax=Calliphora vicina TaxID=7373 RepID=UPI00325ABF0C
MTLEEVKQQRANTKKSITRIKNQVEANGRGEGKTLSSAELKCRLGILESYFKQILTYQTQIEKYDPDDNGRPEIEDLYIAAKMNIQAQLGEDVHNTTMSDSTICFPVNNNKLPQLKLPTFSGKYSEYKNFITSFNQVIDREFGLSNIEKFNHLLNCLQGQALETVKAFQITNENYPKALERLKTRYDNSSLIFMENITTLFELPAMSKYNCAQLRSLVDNVSALYSSLLSLGSDSDIANSMLIYIVLEKVDDETKRKWKDSLDFTELPSWDDCSKVLERHCQFLESVDTSHTNVAHRKPDNHQSGKSKYKSSKTGYSFSVSKRVCVLCTKTDHTITRCPRFKDMDVGQRFENVKRLGLCLNCLSKGHQVNSCSSTFKCKSCSRLHHSLLHRSQSASRPSSPTAEPSTSRAALNDSHASVHTHMEKSSPEQVLLATAMVLVRDATGHYQFGRALLDSCSQLNFITDEFSQKLHLPRRKQTTEVASIGNTHSKTKYRSSTNVKSRVTDFEVSLSFCVTPHISYQPDAELDVSTWNLPPNTQLADENFFKSKRIDLLIGTETFFDILSVGQIKLGPNLPKLHKTLFGWIVAGRYLSNQSNDTGSSCMLSIEEEVDLKLQRLWEIEEIPSGSNTLTPEQADCESFFNNTVHRESSGRIVVKLPFKESADTLGLSRNMALKRFASQERRFARDSNLKSQYVSFMKEYEDCGHMSLVRSPRLDVPHYFIPHHCVFKPNSTSTKLRVVFDASCPSSSQRSLNDILMVGPTIQDELYKILLRFRLHRFVITADIVKMYRQVLIDSSHRKFQYILWRNSEEEEIRTYQLNTVTYGMSAAPYLAIKSLHYLADQYMDQFELGAKTIKSSFYVDDFIGGADSIEELTKIKTEVNEILIRGSFQLDKWHSNHRSFQDDKTIKDLNIDELAVTNALGITWDQQKDVFLFSFTPKVQIDGKITKRTILSLSSSLFDPLGLLAPLIIKSKIIMQELWILKIGWDESIPQELHLAWEYFVSDLKTLNSLEIPRFCLAAESQSVQLHGFCDSSIRAYGCCFYFRVKTYSGNVSVRLFTAKSRVAPTKRKSLPKLELCGAQLLAKLYSKVKNLFAIPNLEVFLWTDSQIVLHWLKQHSSTLSVFVGNRVSEIQDLTTGCIWRHVPTHFNPADIVSRGSTVEELASSIWFNGPAFLTLGASKWPPNKIDQLSIENQQDIDREKRKTVLSLEATSNYILDSVENYSSYLKIIRIVAWMLRFSQKTKTNIFHSDSLQPQELENALLRIVFNLQQHHFQDDIQRALKKNDPQGALKCLNPFIDSSNGFNLLKVGGRLEFAAISEGQKHPIILPSKNHFVDCYVRHLHISNYHAGPKALMSLIRQRFWIINSRNLCRRIVNSCPQCIRYRPRLLQQMMGNLPVERLNPSRPFARCAVDFCGPVNTYLRIRGKVPYKTYIAVFVCLATKAVHLEVVSDLSTDAFIAALKRMIGRRGLPTDIFCDNATNFVGANSKLAQLKSFLFDPKNSNFIINYCSNQFINFRFIPPRAPHFGGLWEAAVKSAKGHLTRTLDNTRLTYEELATAMIDIEAILNSRPISPLSSDPSDFEALTPGHFLIGAPLRSLPERDVPPIEINKLEYWARISAIKQHFWKKWSHDYINELQTRNKWTSTNSNICTGSLVIIKEDNLPPQRWLMGKIINIVRGRDDRVRVVDIKTTKGIIRRPIHRLALLFS